MKSPRISVCIPTYNYGRYLPEAIESILNQKFTDFEILIIDDCSKDHTAEVVKRYAVQDSRIVFSINSKNIGMVGNWNLCLARSRGEYIKYVFGDDVLCSQDALGQIMEPLAADRSVTLVATARKIIDGKSKVLKIRSSFSRSLVLPGVQAIRRCMFDEKNLIGEPTVVMFRKADAGRGFDPRYRQIVDLEMWYHLLEKGRLVYLAEPLCGFRRHAEQQSEHNHSSFATLDDMILILEDYLAKPALDLGPLQRRRIVLDYCYFVWKNHRGNHLSRDEAMRRINAFVSFDEFVAILPFYKLARPILKLNRQLSRRFATLPAYP